MSTVKANEYRNLLNTGSSPNVTLAQDGGVEIGEDLNVPQGNATIGGNTSITGTLTVTGTTTANSDITGNIKGDVKNPSGDVVLDSGTASGGADATFTGNAASASKWDNTTTIQLTGDVTGSVSIDGSESSNAQLATTIGSLTVDLGDIKNVAQETILGNKTSSAAPPTALSKADATALINIYTAPTSNTPGIKGLVPSSNQGDQASSKFLKIDGNWTLNNSFPGLSGDVTSGIDGVSTIGSNKVTYAKMQDITGERLLGKTSSGGGDITEIDKAGLRSFIGTINSTSDTGLVPALPSGWTSSTVNNRYVLYADPNSSAPEWGDKSDVCFAKQTGALGGAGNIMHLQQVYLDGSAARNNAGWDFICNTLKGTTGNYYNYGGIQVSSSLSTVRAFIRLRANGQVGLDINTTSNGVEFNSVNDTSVPWGQNPGTTDYDRYNTAFKVENVSSTSAGNIYTKCHIKPLDREDVELGAVAGYLQDHYRNYFLKGRIKTLLYQTLDPQSDRNLKENITESSLGLDFIKTLKPVQFNWKEDEGDKKLSYGFIAQDIEEKVNNGLSFRGWKDGNYPNPNENWEEDGEPEIIDGSQTLDITQFIAPLTKAVQELSAQVEALTTRVTALEG